MLLNAVCYAIYGSTPRGVKVEELVRRGSKKCSVTLELHDHGVAYRIVRSRKPNSLRFYANGVIVEDKPQDAIDRVIGLSLKTFYRCIYFPQKSDTSYLISNDRDKKEILANIIEDLTSFDVANGTEKEDVKVLESKKSNLRYSHGVLDDSVSELIGDLDYHSEKSTEFESDKEKSMAALANSNQLPWEKLDKVA